MLIIDPISGVCKETYTLSGRVLVRKKSGKLIERPSPVLVYLNSKKSFKMPKNLNKSGTRYEMASSNKTFAPGLLPILKGTRVYFPNKDNILHNVFSLSKLAPFDLGLYKKETIKSVKFTKVGIVKVYCNIHEEMVGHIIVLNNPYFVLTDDKGNFKIEDIPRGEYTFSTWSPLTKFTKKKIKIVDNTSAEFDLTSITISLKHLNKWGKRYIKKY